MKTNLKDQSPNPKSKGLASARAGEPLKPEGRGSDWYPKLSYGGN